MSSPPPRTTLASSPQQQGRQLKRKLQEAKCGVIYLDEYLRRRDALMAKLVALVAAHRVKDDLRVVAAGGDGTVSWVSELIRDACALANTRAVPPIAILSLGTGNELANVTGWGKRYATGDSLVPFVRDVAGGRVVDVDAWIWRATPLETGPDGRVLDVPRRNARPPPRVFSVGARALHDFDGNPGGDDPGGDGSAGPGGFVTAASRDVRDGGPSSLRADASGISGSDPDPSPRRDPLSTNNPGGAPDHHHAGTSPESRRRSISAARRAAMESDDLPHLPELAFAPPPMTPPGGGSKSHRSSPTTDRRTRAANDAAHRPPKQFGGFEHPLANGPSSVEASRGDASSHSERLASRRAGGRRGSRASGASFGSGASALGPANNGIGFGRRRNQSRGSSLGGSADFANEGFDDISVDGGSSDAGSGDEEATVDVVEKTSVCFFSVGFDASIAMQFHQLRERTPCCADNVTKIVAGHAVLGFAEAFAARKYLRPGVISLRVDGEAVAIPPGARTLQFFNIHSSATGIDFFGTGEPSEPTELQRFEPPCIGDGLIEVVATMSAWHLGAIRLGFGHSHRVAQGASVEVILREALPVQVDGEPWLQPPAVVHVSSGGKIPFVIGTGETRNVPEMAHVRVRSVDIPEEDTQGARATSSGTTTGRE